MNYDPYFNNVSLLLHFDGASGSTDFVDNSSKLQVVNYEGSTSLNNTNYKFGSASAYFNSLGSKVYVANSPDFVFGSADFTIECWVYIVTGQAYARIIHFGPFWQSNNAFNLLAIDADYPNKITFARYKLGVSRLCVSTLDIKRDTWYNVAVTRKDGIFRLFINGILESTNSNYVGITIEENTTTTVTVGSAITTSGGEDLIGYVDELRITKGIARYVSNFTVQTESFPNGNYIYTPVSLGVGKSFLFKEEDTWVSYLVKLKLLTCVEQMLYLIL